MVLVKRKRAQSEEDQAFEKDELSSFVRVLLKVTNQKVSRETWTHDLRDSYLEAMEDIFKIRLEVDPIPFEFTQIALESEASVSDGKVSLFDILIVNLEKLRTPPHAAMPPFKAGQLLPFVDPLKKVRVPYKGKIKNMSQEMALHLIDIVQNPQCFFSDVVGQAQSSQDCTTVQDMARRSIEVSEANVPKRKKVSETPSDTEKTQEKTSSERRKEERERKEKMQKREKKEKKERKEREASAKKERVPRARKERPEQEPVQSKFKAPDKDKMYNVDRGEEFQLVPLAYEHIGSQRAVGIVRATSTSSPRLVFVIAPSKDEGKLGLFAGKGFYKDATIARYGGKIVTGVDADFGKKIVKVRNMLLDGNYGCAPYLGIIRQTSMGESANVSFSATGDLIAVSSDKRKRFSLKPFDFKKNLQHNQRNSELRIDP